MATATKTAAPKSAAGEKHIAKKQGVVSVGKADTINKNNRVVFRPDGKQSAILQKMGRVGAANAIRASKALGLPITYMEKGVVVRELSNGVKEIIAAAPSTVGKKTGCSLKKGMIFHVKK